jgi:hypothetical protein
MHGIKKIIKIVLTSFFAWALVANVNAFADIEKNALNATTDEARTCAVYFKILGLKYDAMPDFPEKKDEMALIKIYEMKAQSSYVKFSQKIALPDKEFADSIKKEFQRMLKISGSNYQNTSELIDIYANDCESHVKNTEKRYEHWKNISKNKQTKQAEKVEAKNSPKNSLNNLTFPFTVDEQVQTANKNQDDIFVNTLKSNELNTDKFWNTPLTRLDYYLMQIKKAADKVSKDIEMIHSDGSSILGSYFQKIENQKEFHKIFGKYQDFQVSNYVNFNEEKGKIFITFDIEKVGKAKKPMKEICRDIAEQKIGRSLYLPSLEKASNSINKLLLGQLNRGGDYSKELEKISNNIVYQVRITSVVNNQDMFNMSCYLTKNSLGRNEINYTKWSLALKK